jgi:hypothetical protein
MKVAKKKVNEDGKFMYEAKGEKKESDNQVCESQRRNGHLLL